MKYLKEITGAVNYLREISDLNYRLGLAVGALEGAERLVRDNASDNDADRLVEIIGRISVDAREETSNVGSSA